jgi:hypothetical protein
MLLWTETFSSASTVLQKTSTAAKVAEHEFLGMRTSAPLIEGAN